MTRSEIIGSLTEPQQDAGPEDAKQSSVESYTGVSVKVKLRGQY